MENEEVQPSPSEDFTLELKFWVERLKGDIDSSMSWLESLIYKDVLDDFVIAIEALKE